MGHPTYNKRPTVNDKDGTILTTATELLCQKYGLSTPTEQSTLLTIVYQLAHNNTIGWSLDDILNRLDTLLSHAQDNKPEPYGLTGTTTPEQAQAILPPRLRKQITDPNLPHYQPPLVMPIDENLL